MVNFGSPSSSQVVIAIDFGTTYSGVAYMPVHTNGAQPDSPTVIARWPGSSHTPKVRTEVDYDRSGKFRAWGFTVDSGEEEGYRMSYFKNLLPIRDPRRERLTLQEIYGENLPEQITLQSAMKDYIQSLYDYVVQILITDGAVLSQSVTSSLNFVFTFPASWSLSTVDAFKKTLISTTINEYIIQNKVHYLKEPEAAMIGTLSSPRYIPDAVRAQFQEQPSHDYDQQVAILDMGGGTVDFSACSVKCWDPLELHVLNTDGIHTGGSKIDKSFLQYFTTILGDNQPQKSKKLEPWVEQALLREFASKKHSFPHDEFYLIPLPRHEAIPDNLPVVGIEKGRMKLTREQMSKFFTPVVGEIIKFLDEKKVFIRQNLQWKSIIIFLVGGLAESPYVQKRIKEWAETKAANANLLIPLDCWTSVVTGATQHGRLLLLDNVGPIRTRASAYSLGIVTDLAWEDDVHSRADKRKDAAGRRIAKNQIRWIVNKGDQLDNSRQFRIQLTKNFSPWPLFWREVIVKSQLDKMEASSRWQGEDILNFCEVECSGSEIPHNQRKKGWKLIPFKRYYTLNYELSIRFTETNMIVEMFYRRQKYGYCEVNYKDHFQEGDKITYFRGLEGTGFAVDNQAQQQT